MPNAPTNPPPQQLVINDFTPGIRMVKSLNHPPGTALHSNGDYEASTYGCYASPADGVLRALPKRTASITGLTEFAGANLTSEQYRIVGIFANDPVFSATTVPGIDQCNTELWVAVEYYTNAPAREKRVLRYSRHQATPAFTVIGTDTTAAAAFSATSRPSACYFATTRSNNATPAVPGIPIVAWGFSGFGQFFPDDLAPGVNGVVNLPNGGVLYPIDQIVGYQNRIVAFPLNVFNGAGTGVNHPDNELIYWTAVNDARTLDPALGGSYTNVVAYVERDTGYAIQAMVSNDQLLLVKRAGGGVVLQGDLNDYTAIPQPGIRSPGLSINQGTNTVLGYMYPCDNGGVWLLSGSMTSRNVSPYMEDDFWRPRPVSPANPTFGNSYIQSANGWGTDYTSCASWQQWVLFPANWMYDTDTQAWWRLDVTPPIDYTYQTARDVAPPTADDLAGPYEAHWWTTDWTGRWAWSAPSGYTEDTQVVFNEYDRRTPRNDFSWLSHPLAFSIDKKVEIQDIILTVESFDVTSTIIVQVLGGTPLVTDVAGDKWGFDLNAEGMMTVKSPAGFGVQGSSLQLWLRSESNDVNEEAPRIHRIEIQYVEIREPARAVGF